MAPKSIEQIEKQLRQALLAKHRPLVKRLRLELLRALRSKGKNHVG